MKTVTVEGFEGAIEAILDAGSSPAIRRQLISLDARSTDAVAQSLIAPPRSVFIVRAEDADLLLAFRSVFVDCGRKHPTAELARRMLGHARVALSATDYQSATRLSQGIASLRAAAEEHGEYGPYAVAVSAAVYDAIRKEAATTAAAERAQRRAESPYARLLAQLPDEAVPPRLRDQHFIGESDATRYVRRRIMQVADRDTLVLILGPSGAGKEVVARAIHEFGPNGSEPFNDINCGAIPATLFESELFGYVKGAFTGAEKDTPGLWEAAGSGTMFLDEVGELSLELQAKLLRALDQRAVRRVGSTASRKVGARVLAATNRNLDAMVRAGEFREDLYYRLRDELLLVPPLRDHLDDVPRLAQYFWRQIAGKGAVRTAATSRTGAVAAATASPAQDARERLLAPGVLAWLMSYRWPGNVRELKSVLNRLHALFEEPVPRVSELETVFALEGQLAVLTAGILPLQTRADHESAAASAEEGRSFRGECLQHLRRADEILRACEVTLAPLMRETAVEPREAQRVHDVLHLRLQELEELCMHPLLSRTDAAYRATHRLKRRLQDVHALIESDLGAARRLWLGDARRELGLAREIIFAETKELVGRG